MSRLPTVGDDLNAWGTILNDYLSVSHNADGTEKSSSPSPGDTTLSSTAVSATSAVQISSATGVVVGSLVAVGVGTSTCEVRRVTAVSSSTLTLNATFKWTHTSGQIVRRFEFWASPTWWGAIAGNSTVDSYRNLSNMFLDLQTAGQGAYGIVGDGHWSGQAFYSSRPLWFPDGAIMSNITLSPFSTFALDCTQGVWTYDNWPHQHFVNSSGQFGLAVSADPAADTITLDATPGALEGEPVAFCVREGKGTLPGGLEEGRTYYCKTFSGANKTVTLSIDKWGASTVNITDAGSGEICWWSTGNTRIFLDRVYILGPGKPGNLRGLNGYLATLQQQSNLKDFRVEGFAGCGVTLCGQQSEWINPEIINNARIGMRIAGGEFVYFHGGNFEINDINFQFTDQYVNQGPGSGASIGICKNVLISGVHFENQGNRSALVQTIASTSAASSGTWTLNGQVLNYNATAADVQTACDTLFGASNTVVTGGALPGASITITFQGVYQYGWGPTLTIVSSVSPGTYTLSAISPTGCHIDFNAALDVHIQGCIDSSNNAPDGTGGLPFLKVNGAAALATGGNQGIQVCGYTLESIGMIANTGNFVYDPNRKTLTRGDSSETAVSQSLTYYAAPGRHAGTVSKQWWFLGDNGRFAAFGGVGAPTLDIAGASAQNNQLIRLVPGSTQTGNSLEAYNTASTLQFTVTPAGDLQLGGATGPRILAFSATPEGVFSGAPGSLCLNFNGGAATSLYVKQTAAAATTGWAGK